MVDANECISCLNTHTTLFFSLMNKEKAFLVIFELSIFSKLVRFPTLPTTCSKKKQTGKRKKDYLAHWWAIASCIAHTSSSTSYHFSHLIGVVITQQSWINKSIEIAMHSCFREQRPSL